MAVSETYGGGVCRLADHEDALGRERAQTVAGVYLSKVVLDAIVAPEKRGRGFHGAEGADRLEWVIL